MKFNKSRLIFGGIMLAGMVLGFSWWVNHIRTDLHFVENTQPLTVAQLPSLAEGQPVLLTGIITSDSPRFYNNIVVGLRERYYSGEDGGWEIEEDPEVRIGLEIKGGQTVPLFIDNPSPRGSYETIRIGNTRWKGYAAESLITSFAVVSQSQPLLFESFKHFGGTHGQYIKSLKSSLSSSRVLAAVLIGVFALIMFWPERRHHKKNRG